MTNVRACRVPSGKRGGGQGGSGNALHVEADHKRRSVAKQLQPFAVWQPVHTTHLFVDLQQQVVDIALQPIVATVHLALDLQKRRGAQRLGASNERLRASKGRGTHRADEQALQR